MAGELDGFFTGAQRMDSRLRDTAALINTGFRTQTMAFTSTMIEAIKAIDPRTLVKSIPAGLPATVQNRIYLVFSELAARRFAFNPILDASSGQSIARDSQEGKRVLEGLSHGVGPAARFPADLAAARSLARSEPPIPVAAPNSRASAEVAIRTTYILVRNSGCGASGGWVQTTPAPLSWTGQNDGSVGGVAFHAVYRAGDGWRVDLGAC